MSLNDLAQPKPWMNQEERQTAATLIAAFRQHFADRAVPESPFLTLRLKDCILHFTLCERLERSLLADSADITTATAAHIGRARERLRKALKALEDTANKSTPPTDNFPDPVGAHNRLRPANISPAASCNAGVPPTSSRTAGVPPASSRTAGVPPASASRPDPSNASTVPTTTTANANPSSPNHNQPPKPPVPPPSLTPMIPITPTSPTASAPKPVPPAAPPNPTPQPIIRVPRVVPFGHSPRHK